MRYFGVFALAVLGCDARLDVRDDGSLNTAVPAEAAAPTSSGSVSTTNTGPLPADVAALQPTLVPTGCYSDSGYETLRELAGPGMIGSEGSDRVRQVRQVVRLDSLERPASAVWTENGNSSMRFADYAVGSIRVGDALGFREEYLLDAAGRVIESRYDGHLHERFTRDAEGRVVRTDRGDGVAFKDFGYDSEGRVTTAVSHNRHGVCRNEYVWRETPLRVEVDRNNDTEQCSYDFDTKGRMLLAVCNGIRANGNREPRRSETKLTYDDTAGTVEVLLDGTPYHRSIVAQSCSGLPKRAGFAASLVAPPVPVALPVHRVGISVTTPIPCFAQDGS